MYMKDSNTVQFGQVSMYMKDSNNVQFGQVSMYMKDSNNVQFGQVSMYMKDSNNIQFGQVLVRLWDSKYVSVQPVQVEIPFGVARHLCAVLLGQQQHKPVVRQQWRALTHALWPDVLSSDILRDC